MRVAASRSSLAEVSGNGGSMTELAERTGVAPGDGGSAGSPPAPPRARRFGASRGAVVALVVVLVAGLTAGILAATSGSAKHATSPVRAITLVSPSYTPKAVVG